MIYFGEQERLSYLYGGIEKLNYYYLRKESKL